MKILHVVNVGILANGIGAVILPLQNEQARLGHIVKVATVRYLKEAIPPLFEVHTVKEFSKLIDEFSPDVVIVHSLYMIEYISYSKYLSKCGIPYLVELHGALSKENYKKGKFKKYIANLLFFNKFLKGAKSVIYLNQGEYSNSLVKSINPRSVIIPNGCYLPPEVKQFGQILPERLEVLFLGRIDMYHKALDVLLDALSLLEKRGYADKVHFLFHGTGAEKDLITFKSAINKFSTIADFEGPVYGKEKEMTFQKSHIFILNSRSEGMPMGILEALSYGLPCIVSPQTNMAEIIHDNDAGWITGVSPEEICDTFVRAYQDYQRDFSGYAQRAYHLAEQFSWQKIAIESSDCYASVVTKNNSECLK